MTQAWTVKVWAGAYSWTVRSTDTAASMGFGPGVPILVTPLQVGSSLPTTDLTPLVQPNSDSATISILAARVADLDQLSIGNTVTVRYWPSATPAAGDHPLVEFAGRVSTVQAQPHDRGVLYQLGCTDYLADLGEAQVGATPYPTQTLDARMRAILTDAGYTVPVGVNFYDEIFLPIVNRNILTYTGGLTSALDLITHTLAQFTLDYSTPPLMIATLRQATIPGGRRQAIGPNTYPATFASGPAVLDPAGPFLIGAIGQHGPAYMAPLRVSLLAGVYTLTASTAQSDVGGVTVLDGSRVDRAVTFNQRKGDAINAVTVTSTTVGPVTVSWPGLVPVRAVVETELTSTVDTGTLANFYFPPVKPSAAALWVADSLTWEIGKEPGAWTMPALGRGLMVANVLWKWSPIEREWYVGLCTGWTFTIDDTGQPSAVVNVVPWNVDTSTASNPIRFSDLAAGQTYANTSPRDTFADYALAGH